MAPDELQWYRLWILPHHRGVKSKVIEEYVLFPVEVSEKEVKAEVESRAERSFGHLENGYEYGFEKLAKPPPEYTQQEIQKHLRRIEFHTHQIDILLQNG